MPKEGSPCICPSMVLIDSVFKMCKNYYSQVFLEEDKHNVKEKEVTKYIKKILKFLLIQMNLVTKKLKTGLF